MMIISLRSWLHAITNAKKIVMSLDKKRFASTAVAKSRKKRRVKGIPKSSLNMMTTNSKLQKRPGKKKGFRAR